MANSDSFTLEFEFSDNRIMENRTLRKHYYMSSDSMMERAEGTVIRWINNDFTKRGDSEQSCKSFFNFFRSVVLPDMQELQDMDEAFE
mmetsp:Transcript_22628/g.3732  ORF Transcript_22628/g.3732 Transcript_22628/m.3732 type:complete len:88 (+) Transcript_22628:339-602(+)|eukprot:CAMPEP_0168313858 /NCGR_PEP_ID=MMETSP0210-20121227/4891_1 /TAXON_ID=40633 /ORGANISM="Condylostoma magnum, Strain COL2" /LENGTH=87 /DNA_ID=CAMNT_0008275895 /DNA_START=251 /DNA_END=514 /DNA_ORIENTATION=+